MRRNQSFVQITDPQYKSHVFVEGCESLSVEHERIPLLEDEYLSRYECQSYEEAYQAVAKFIHFYNTK
ncbi:hypothetical protein [Bacillus taeanensis]|uniref:hypothetical protein n=1 Tax=Bacillus taeanensis TaxID=273032 RepID=UPI0015EFF660|nr:hypothetical protein [Bacillus taeanensis]